MPAHATIDAERRIVFTDCSGTVTDEEFLRARKQILADPAFDPSFDRLWDFSAVSHEEVSQEAVAHLVKTSPSLDGTLRAVVVSAASQTLPRVLEFVAESRRLSRPIAIFPTREAAEQWIDHERRAQAPGAVK